MTDIPAQRSDATPDQVTDGLVEAQAILDDPSKKDTAEWLAAKQLLVNEEHQAETKPKFAELEREMDALRGMSEI